MSGLQVTDAQVDLAHVGRPQRHWAASQEEGQQLQDVLVLEEGQQLQDVLEADEDEDEFGHEEQQQEEEEEE